jgi:predicted phosphodiesterase
MVRKANILLQAAILSVTLAACTVDIFGLFASADMSERWAARNNFVFLSDPASRSLNLGDTYSFIIVADTHFEGGDDFGFAKIKNAIDSNIKFVVVDGDITQNGARTDIQSFIEIANTFGVPCYPVAGNHDMYFGNFPIWKELIGSTCYSVNSDSTRLIILDSANAHFGREQLDWLEGELNSANGKRVFVFTHSNLFINSMFDITQFTDTRERARVVSMLEGRCDGMFMGHLHRRVVTTAGGVQYLSIEDFRHNKAYCRVDVTPSGVSWEIKKL